MMGSAVATALGLGELGESIGDERKSIERI
jgi:hypothetical protein